MAKEVEEDPRTITPERLQKWCHDSGRDDAMVGPFQEVLTTAQRVVDRLSDVEHQVVWEYDFPEGDSGIREQVRKADLIIAIGGDGFQNKALRHSMLTPVLGIRGDRGSVGEQLWGDIDQFERTFPSGQSILDTLRVEHYLERIPRLQISSGGAVLGEPASMILCGAESIQHMSKYWVDYKLPGGGEVLRFKQSSSGVIISTRLGQGAYLSSTQQYSLCGWERTDYFAMVHVMSPHTTEIPDRGISDIPVASGQCSPERWTVTTNPQDIFARAILKIGGELTLTPRMHQGGKLFLDGDGQAGFDWNRANHNPNNVSSFTVSLAPTYATLFVPPVG